MGVTNVYLYIYRTIVYRAGSFNLLLYKQWTESPFLQKTVSVNTTAITRPYVLIMLIRTTHKHYLLYQK